MQEIALTAEERHRLLAVLRELDGEAPPEKRRDPRRKVRSILWIRPVSKRRAELLRTDMVNVSAHGVAILANRPFAKGDKFLLPLRFREGGGWLVLSEVRNCAEAGQGKWKIGAQFLDRVEDPEGNAKPPLDWLL